MREAFAKTPDLRIQSEYYLVLHDMYHRGVLLIVERMEEGRGRNSYPCPFVQCKGRKYRRLADHISATHNLKGSVNRDIRHKALDLAHSQCKSDGD